MGRRGASSFLFCPVSSLFYFRLTSSPINGLGTCSVFTDFPLPLSPSAPFPPHSPLLLSPRTLRAWPMVKVRGLRPEASADRAPSRAAAALVRHCLFSPFQLESSPPAPRLTACHCGRCSTGCSGGGCAVEGQNQVQPPARHEHSWPRCDTAQPRNLTWCSKCVGRNLTWRSGFVGRSQPGLQEVRRRRGRSRRNGRSRR